MARRSSIDDLDPAIQSELHAAMRRGATIDHIVDRLRGLGADVSRSAVGRYTHNYAALAKQQREMRSVAEAFGKEFGGADDHQGRMMIQLMTSMITRTIMPLATGESEEAEDLSGLELSRLAKAVKDATSASKIDIEREAKIRDEAAKNAKIEAAANAETAARASGASEDTLRRIRAGILGLTA